MLIALFIAIIFKDISARSDSRLTSLLSDISKLSLNARTKSALVPVVIGVFAAQHIDGTIVEGYRKHETAVDRSSWSYSDTDSGLDGACSVANKCGPASWSKVNI